jgi:hypothetical protein
MKLLAYVAVTGNTLFLLFLIYNAIDERTPSGMTVGIVQQVAQIGLLVLLALNLFVLLKKK